MIDFYEWGLTTSKTKLIICPVGAVALPRAPFGQGTGLILLDNLFCSGTQLYLFNCTHNGVGNHNCAHSEDAGLRCVNSTVSKSLVL